MSDKTDLWMPLYVGDYLADTQHLTCEQHGAYFLLMMFYWRHGSLPDDNSQLASIAKISAHKWKKISPIIRKFFNAKEGLLRHKRIDAELSKAAENKEKRSEKARAAAKVRWQDNDAPSMPGECPSPSPITSPTEKGQTPFSVEAEKDLDAVLYQRGKKILGKTAGGQITKLKQILGTGKALEAIDIAGRKENPNEYVAGVIRGNRDNRDSIKKGPGAAIGSREDNERLRKWGVA